MTRFIRVNLASYDADGFPVTCDDDRWLNVDHIVHIEEHLGNNLFRRFQLDDKTADQYYPCLLITTTDRRERLIFLGIRATAEDATEALEEALKEIVIGHRATLSSYADRAGAEPDVPPF